jgi:hypothetical protein
MANPWLTLVNEKLQFGRSKNEKYNLQNAIQDAKKEYKPKAKKSEDKKTRKQRRKKNSRRLRKTKGGYSRKNL